MAERTLYRMFAETVQAHGDRPAVGFHSAKSEPYTYWTYRELDAKVRAFARGLDALGLQKGDRIALISHENRVEWAVTDLASQYLGIVTVPIYGTLPASQVAYYVKDSGARAILVSDAKQRAKVKSFSADTPTLENIISMDGRPEEMEAEGALTFESIYKLGEDKGREPSKLDALSNAVGANDLATLIYTSGTTGDPKGAMLSHSNVLQTPDNVVSGGIADLGPDDVYLSFLPLSHITERVGGQYLPLRYGSCIVYSLGLMALSDEIITTVRPTAMLMVPRIWENMHDKAREAIAKQPEKERKIVEWGLGMGIEAARRRSAGRGLGPLLAVQHALADKLVLSKLREKVTGGRLRNSVSGGAPLNAPIAEFFLGIGIHILEGYGLSETNIIAINHAGSERIGTVGPLTPKTEVKIADDGEILMRGQGQMLGYYNKPEATKEAIDAEGWFHTGDIGELSPRGYLTITDRKKDLLVLTNGKKVAPQPIEALLKRSHYIGEAVLFGDKASTVSALILPDFDMRGRPAHLIAWAKEKGIDTENIEELLTNADVLKLYKSEIDANTKDLADFEKIKKFKLVGNPFSIDGGEFTPTLKVKRKFVAQKYADLIATMSRG